MTLVLQHSLDFDLIDFIQLNMQTKNKMSGYISEREREKKMGIKLNIRENLKFVGTFRIENNNRGINDSTTVKKVP